MYISICYIYNYVHILIIIYNTNWVRYKLGTRGRYKDTHTCTVPGLGFDFYTRFRLEYPYRWVLRTSPHQGQIPTGIWVAV